jgi:dTDP-glucose 4,6-dehydratase
MDVKIEIESKAERIRPEKSEVERLWADNAKAKRILNWEPQFGGKEGLKRGLRETIAWFNNKENLKMYKVDIYNI